ncbi:polysaccharide deacetylase family protein [Conexibacter woesei]|uniref:polysaccharide deacetylase family protein n=1 Tax=Conexibacter woesei TaxID=191495 RepID=UPI000423F341|nr:polysaccharide deacetylase family protein [Conexibacter woesei]
MSDGRIALTFDDGPDPLWTPQVLDALAEADARATFFVLAPRAAAEAALIARMQAEGHGVQLHAYAHIRHTKLTEETGAEDTDRALSMLSSLSVEPELWRTPWGVTADWTEDVAAARGLELVRWTADTHDWRGDSATAMLAAIDDEVADGAIVLAHDALGPGATRSGCAETVALVAPLVALARDRGLEPVTLCAGCPEAVCP